MKKSPGEKRSARPDPEVAADLRDALALAS